MPFLSFRWVVNFVLLAVPIGTTLGVLMGLDAGRSSSGQKPLFTQPETPGVKPKKNNSITAMVSCDRSTALFPQSEGQQYIFNPNQWGWTEGSDGALCMNVSSFNNQTYATNFTAPQFYVTWRYPRGPETQPVHAFPNVKLDSDKDKVVPVSISSLSQINVDIAWSYSVGNYSTDGDTAAKTDEAALIENQTNTNVAIDMFLDSDKDASADSTKAKYEVMVWLATYGSATQPIGYQGGAGALTTETIGGATFQLFYGQNGLKQHVLTWKATTNIPHFTGDLAPLLAKLPTMNRAEFPTGATYVGYMGLGSEALSAKNVVTFRVPTLSLEVKKTT